MQTSGMIPGANRYPVSEVMEQVDLLTTPNPEPTSSGGVAEPFAYHCYRDGRNCFSRTLREGDAALWQMSGAHVTSLYKEAPPLRPACKGRNCNATDGVSHSPECQADHDAVTTLATQPIGGEWVRNRLVSALRQYRHNNDNSPDMFNPEQGFTFGYDVVEVDKIINEMLGQDQPPQDREGGV